MNEREIERRNRKREIVRERKRYIEFERERKN